MPGAAFGGAVCLFRSTKFASLTVDRASSLAR